MRLLVLALVAAAAVTAVVATPASPATTCARWAAPNGDDAGAGTRAQPFRTIGKLASSLRPGQVGCLEPGTTFEERARVDASGAPGLPIRITSGPGSRAILADGLETTQTSKYVTFDNLVLGARKGSTSGSQAATVVVRGFSIRLSRSDVSAGSVIGVPRSCIVLDHARRAVLDRNRIRDCGGLPRGTLYAAGVSVAIAVNTTISDNTIFGNPGDAIALAPDAQRSVVARNLIVANDAGVFFSGGPKVASRDNSVTRNVIAQSIRFAVHGSYRDGAPVGRGNVVAQNCFWASQRVGGQGFAATGNRTVNPRVRPAATGYRLLATSPCAAYRPAP